MDLILWRHAEAEEGFPDERRSLSRKGQKQAARVAQWLRGVLVPPYRLLVSPTLRTQQTAQALGLDFTTDTALAPGSTPAQLLQAAEWPEASASVVVVGHQPTLGQTAALLMTGTEEPWSVSKGAIWWLSRRKRNGESQVLLRAVLNPELL